MDIEASLHNATDIHQTDEEFCIFLEKNIPIFGEKNRGFPLGFQLLPSSGSNSLPLPKVQKNELAGQTFKSIDWTEISVPQLHEHSKDILTSPNFTVCLYLLTT